MAGLVPATHEHRMAAAIWSGAAIMGSRHKAGNDDPF
jgi:hypothetical protein